MKIEIVNENNCSWCELPNGNIIYGKNQEDIENVLSTMSKIEKFETKS